MLGWLALAARPGIAQIGGYVAPNETTFMTASLLQDPLPAPGQGTPELPSTDVMQSPPAVGQVQPYFDMDQYLDSYPHMHSAEEPWSWSVLPSGIIYKSYLAGMKESRMSGQITHQRDHYAMWDSSLGARVGLLRYGNTDPIAPQGFQMDVEGSAQVRLDIRNDVDVQAVDFRGGVPLTYGIGPHRFKFAYYHLSSHAGDEFLLNNPGFNRINFARDVFVLGYSYYWAQNLRLYAETGWAFYTEVCKPWEFQFGVDWAPTRPTGFRGAPFFAINGHLRQELSFGGNLSVQTGWAWVGDGNSHLLRLGFLYYNGGSNQFEFYKEHEQYGGVGVWYDF